MYSCMCICIHTYAYLYTNMYINGICVSIYLLWNFQQDTKCFIKCFSSHIYKWLIIFYFVGIEKLTIVAYEIID